MKTLILLILTFCTASCATLGNYPGARGSAPSTANDGASGVSAPPATNSAFQNQNMSPQIIIPVTGGPAVIGIPVGGNLFVPVTGGAPVLGIPTNP